MDKVTRTDADWRKLLTPEEYAVLRQADTDQRWCINSVSLTLEPSGPGAS